MSKIQDLSQSLLWPKLVQFRALNLQLKLFGLALVLLPRQSWHEFVHEQQGSTKKLQTNSNVMQPTMKNQVGQLAPKSSST